MNACQKNQKVNLEERLEDAMHDHLERYIKIYDQAQDRGNKDVLEYRYHGKNLVIDRSLLASYLSLKAVRANNVLQKWVIAFGFISSASAFITALTILGVLK